MKPTLALLALLLATPAAAAVDLLPTEVAFGRDEARLLVRSSTGGVHVRTEPSVLAAGVAPGETPEELSPTPLAIEATHVWRGIDGIVELVLRRDDATSPVDIIVEDGTSTGVWLEWPAERRVPAVGVSVLLSTLGMVALRYAKAKGFPPPPRLR